jgi:HAMP domain-containing protein
MMNVMLYALVVRRVTRVSKIADQVSLGNMEAGEFKSQSKDEIGVLTEALGRMKTSVVQAMNMLDGK